MTSFERRLKAMEESFEQLPAIMDDHVKKVLTKHVGTSHIRRVQEETPIEPAFASDCTCDGLDDTIADIREELDDNIELAEQNEGNIDTLFDNDVTLEGNDMVLFENDGILQENDQRIFDIFQDLAQIELGLITFLFQNLTADNGQAAFQETCLGLAGLNISNIFCDDPSQIESIILNNNLRRSPQMSELESRLKHTEELIAKRSEGSTILKLLEKRGVKA